jgi:type I restriction enzyme S subunit
MSHLNFDYVPLTFINDQEEIKKQIRNTLILIHLVEKYNNPVRLEQLIEGTQYGYNASALQSGKNKFLRISDIHESKVIWETVPYCNCDDEKTYLLKKDDILIARTGGTTGKSFKIDNPPAHSIYAGYLIRIRAKQEVNPDYIYLFLHSFAYWSQIVNLNERNFRPKANAENLKSLILPDCPSNVQTDAVRIANGESVKGYEELYSEIEKVLAEYNKTQEVQKLLYNQLTQLDNLNQAILQEAVQGKLVPQDPKDEPASELLKRIKAEKATLRQAQGKGKKEKPLPPIKPEEIPFEIPENWVWCRLGEICDNITKGSSPNWQGVQYVSEGEGILFITSKNVDSFKIDLTKASYVEEKFNEIEPRSILKKGDILTNIVGASIGRTALFDLDVVANINQAVCILRIEHSFINKAYLLNLMNSNLALKLMSDNSFAPGRANLSMGDIANFPIPLPPLSEQKRIVAEIEKQFTKTKQLKEHITQNQQATEQLLKALLHQAFEVREMVIAKPKGKVIELKPTNVDYYRRTVLAAEIVWQLHKEPTLGHLKLQKLIYLCQKSADMQLPTNFLRQAMGPYDNRLMRSIDKQLKEKKWFEYKKEQVLKYQPLEKAGQHHNDFIKYFSAESESIQFIIDRFKTIKSDIVEIVATLYACMDNMLNENVIFSEALLFQRFYEWSEEKKKFSEKEVERVFSRMKDTGIIPKGYNF